MQTEESMNIAQFTEQAYLNYAMYVVLDRALPHLADGLKPVQRRIIYAMSELGLKHIAAFKKSARTIGDVIGKFHPHGDTACYEAMVMMAQPFHYRYPVIIGQGNWGSIEDPKSFAAMRYTEAKLAQYAQVFLEELNQGSVEWVPNFDGSLTEPKLLPARLPNILLNGAHGIAVGMATDIPPHNLNEVVDACVHLIDDPETSLDKLMTFVPGPDFPTGGELISRKIDIRNLYETGHGQLRLRARFTSEEKLMIVDELPFQVTSSKVIKQIADLMLAKKLPGVVDVRDESDYEHPTRLVIELKSSRLNSDDIMEQLFASTDLETSVRVNLNIIDLDRKPKVLSLKNILSQWLDFRRNSIRQRSQHRLNQINDRLHIIEGLLTIFIHIDRVIAIIRQEDDPKAALIKQFSLSEIQAQAILDIRLRQLAKIQEIALKDEQKSLLDEQAKLNHLLANTEALDACMKTELIEDKSRFGNPRRTLCVEKEPAKAITQQPVLSHDPISIILSNNLWIRQAKGHQIEATHLSFKSGDSLRSSTPGYADYPIILMDQHGRAYTLWSHQLSSARTQGDPVSKFIQPPDKGQINQLITGKNQQNIILASAQGYGFRTTIESLTSKYKQGKAVLNLSTPGAAITHQPKADDTLLAVFTQQHRLLVFPLNDLPQLSKGKGNKLIALDSTNDAVTHLVTLKQDQTLTLHTAKRHLSLTPEKLSFYEGKRGRRGGKIPQGFRLFERLSVE